MQDSSYDYSNRVDSTPDSIANLIIVYAEEGTLHSYYNHENYHETSSIRANVPFCYSLTGMLDILIVSVVNVFLVVRLHAFCWTTLYAHQGCRKQSSQSRGRTSF